MPKSSEIASLLAGLASNRQNPWPASAIEDDYDLALAISDLNRSLNLSETQPRVPILDAALSLMCFTAPQLFQSALESTVKTIVAVLSSSMKCKVSRAGKEEILGVGGSISSEDSLGVMEMCVDILEQLQGHRGDLCPSIMYAALRVAVLAPRFQYPLESNAGLNAKTLDGWNNSVHKLFVHVPKEASFMSGEMPGRLLFWYLDPAILRQDISEILREANRRCFLCLRREFHGRTEWRSILICMVLAPLMFAEARALLHSWFLLTGMPSILELQTDLVSLVLDIISRPMWWGLSLDIGSKLPFSYAYFPSKQKLLRILAGPLSWESFQHLVRKISRVASHTESHHTRSSEQSGLKIEVVDHNSLWAIAMNFPDWFSFATLLLFSSPDIEGSFQLNYLIGSAKTGRLYAGEISHSAAAARFIAWVVSPASDSCQDLLVDYLEKVSGLWTSKRFGSGRHDGASRGYKEEREIKSDELENKTNLNYDSHTIFLWLKEFQDMCLRYFRRVSRLAPSSAHASQEDGIQNSMLIRRIPLGILIGFMDSIDEMGCEFLLHYVATGTIFLSKETHVAGLKYRGRSYERQEMSRKWSESCGIEEAVAGARFVFDLTDVMERMSTSLFENEEAGLNFLRRAKLKVGKYLLKCVKRLLLDDTDEGDRLLMFRDLCDCLVHWGHQGQDVFENYQDLDDVIKTLRHA